MGSAGPADAGIIAIGIVDDLLARQVVRQRRALRQYPVWSGHRNAGRLGRSLALGFAGLQLFKLQFELLDCLVEAPAIAFALDTIIAPVSRPIASSPRARAAPSSRHRYIASSERRPPYPPGRSMLMSRENLGEDPGRKSVMCAASRHRIGIRGYITAGAEAIHGTYHVLCVRPKGQAEWAAP